MKVIHFALKSDSIKSITRAHPSRAAKYVKRMMYYDHDHGGEPTPKRFAAHRDMHAVHVGVLTMPIDNTVT